MKALIIGYGSIGARHAQILDSLGYSLACVTSNPSCPYPIFSTIAEAVQTTSPSLAIISNATVEHLPSLTMLMDTGFTGLILVEKPLFDEPYALVPPRDTIRVAYNLRFHPLVTRTRELLTGQTILNAQFHVGQYLPDWRPGTDYTTSYSASRAQGGGVLRDLSHELDLSCFLLGCWKRVTAIGGHFSDLRIDSDDQFSILMETAGCPAVTIHMDYLSKTTRRGFVITTQEFCLQADFIAGTLTMDTTTEEFSIDRNTTYENQLRAMMVDNPHLCSFEQGMNVVQLIQAVEKSAHTNTWITAP